jgi:hypothetical protein
VCVYEGVSKIFRTELNMKHTLTINTRSEATQRVMAAKLTRLTHKKALQLHLMAENRTTCSSCARRPVHKLLVTTARTRACVRACVHTKSLYFSCALFSYFIGSDVHYLLYISSHTIDTTLQTCLSSSPVLD